MKVQPILISLFMCGLTFSGLAEAGTKTKLSRSILTCQETQAGASVLDGGKQLNLSRDKAGQVYLTLTQKDQFSGDSILLNNLPMREGRCGGFVPCTSYWSADESTKFFVNFVPSSTEGYIQSLEAGSATFSCTRK